MSSILFEQGSIKGVQLKNRFVRSATMEAMATSDGYPTKMLHDLYGKLADGDVGLIVTGGAFIEAWENLPETIGIRSPWAIYHDGYIGPWREVVNAVPKRDTKIAMQIVHLGRLDIPQLRGSVPIAPSPVPIGSDGVVPREMTRHDIEDIVEQFAQASRRVQAAGFDAVQFHGAHGNLIHNFMSPFTNTRTDEYGGSTENRARFTSEIIARTRELVGPDYPLMIKMTFDDFIDGGLTMDEAIDVARTIAEAGIDCIEVSGGSHSESIDHISVKKIDQAGKEAYFRRYAKALKKQVAIPVILVGGLRSPSVMEKELEDGTADFVAMSRPFIREPALVKRWANGDLAKAKCVSCNKCFDNFAVRPLRCYVEDPLDELEDAQNRVF